MNRRNGSKINQILKKWPIKTVSVSPWLKKQGVGRQLVNSYQKGGWLKSIGRGAFVRLDEKVDWTGGLYALQEQLHLHIHAGGKTALHMNGYAHFLPMGNRERFSIFGSSLTKLPSWFKKHDWNAEIEYSRTNLFRSGKNLGLMEYSLNSYSISISAPERAMLELLHFVPKKQTFDEAYLLMEGLTTLRPKLIQKLLESCKSIKAKRLFLFMAEECNHNWVKQLDRKKIDLGEGKRLIVQGGRLDPVYNITVPQKMFFNRQRQIKEFINNRGRSPATRLMVPKNRSFDQISFEDDKGAYHSIAFGAFLSGALSWLDELIKEFKIEKKGTSGFKGNINEDWLNNVENEESVLSIRNASNRTTAALAELVVADELKRRGFKITRLSAWDNENPDISCRKLERDLNVEVKYIGTPPEISESITRQIKGEKSEGGYLDKKAFLNYFFDEKIAKAVGQLQKQPYNSRQVWLIFQEDLVGKRILNDYMKLGPLPKKRCREAEEIETIVLATMKHWKLEDIVEYKTKDLIK